MDSKTMKKFIWFARLALALAFLSAVADRFGWLGGPGTLNVAWGNLESFNLYVAILNPWAPKMLVPVLGWIATSLEIIFAICLLTGYQLRWTSLGSGLLLLLFASAMMSTTGWQSPLNYSVFSAAACAFLMFSILRHQESE
jgi:uncharacterized membrane protein YphA (DoxX/SURF4 family)